MRVASSPEGAASAMSRFFSVGDRSGARVCTRLASVAKLRVRHCKLGQMNGVFCKQTTSCHRLRSLGPGNLVKWRILIRHKDSCTRDMTEGTVSAREGVVCGSKIWDLE